MSLWNELAEPVFDGVELADFKNRAYAFLLTSAALSLSFSLLLPVYRLVLWGWGLWTDRVYITLSALHCRPLIIIIIIIIIIMMMMMMMRLFCPLSKVWSM